MELTQFKSVREAVEHSLAECGVDRADVVAVMPKLKVDSDVNLDWDSPPSNYPLGVTQMLILMSWQIAVRHIRARNPSSFVIGLLEGMIAAGRPDGGTDAPQPEA